jgi:hypothetical protein
MVSEPEYRNGEPLFAYITPERVATVCLCYPEDGSPPLTLVELRNRAKAEAERLRGEGKPDDFIEQMLAALEDVIAHRAAQREKPPAA